MSDLNLFNSQHIQRIKAEERYVEEVVAQINKDAALQGFDLSVNSNSINTYSGLLTEVLEKLGRLSETNPGLLKNFLYQVDVPEKNVHAIISNFPQKDHVKLLCQEIINRCLKKILLFKYYSSGNSASH